MILPTIFYLNLKIKHLYSFQNVKRKTERSLHLFVRLLVYQCQVDINIMKSNVFEVSRNLLLFYR